MDPDQFRYADYLPELLEVDELPPAEAALRLRCQAPGHLPRYIYKYRSLEPSNIKSFERVREILVDSKLWLSSPAAFNDPFDLAPRVIFKGDSPGANRSALWNKVLKTGFGKSVRERKRAVDTILGDPSQYVQGVSDSLAQDIAAFGVCSLARSPANILMWSHYAAYHTGICIRLEVPASVLALATIMKVDYSVEYPTLDAAKETSSQLMEVIARKADLWKYEEEFRLIIPGRANTHYPFRPRACRGVILGCRALMDLAFFAECNQERARAGAPSFKCYRAVRSAHAFKVGIHRCL